VVDETRRSGGVADALVASLVQADFRGRTTVVAAEDSFIPLGPAAEQVLVTEQEVEDRARALAAARPEGGPIDTDR
jgi:2-oxoisovalerate dehydrogenase E1 component